MATMVNRTVWWLHGVTVKSGVVTKQEFNPDFLHITEKNGEQIIKSSLLVFLSLREAINNGIEFAGLLEHNMRKLEELLDE